MPPHCTDMLYMVEDIRQSARMYITVLSRSDRSPLLGLSSPPPPPPSLPRIDGSAATSNLYMHQSCTYSVGSLDTCASIASALNLPLSSLLAFNPTASCGSLSEGQLLEICSRPAQVGPASLTAKLSIM